MAAENKAIIRVDLDNTKSIEGGNQLEKALAKNKEKIVKDLEEMEKRIQSIGASLEDTAKRSTNSFAQIDAAQKRVLNSTETAVKQVNKVATGQVIGGVVGPGGTPATPSQIVSDTAKKSAMVEATKIRGINQLAAEESKRLTQQVIGDQRRLTASHDADLKLRNDATRRAGRETRAIHQQTAREAEFAAKQASPWYTAGWQAKTTKIPASQALQQQITHGFARSQMMGQMQGTLAPATGSQVWQQQMNMAIAQAQGTAISPVMLPSAAGRSPTQAWQQQMNQAIARSNAQAAVQYHAQNIGMQAAGGGMGGIGGAAAVGAAGGGGRRQWRGGGWNRILGGGAGGFAAGMLGGMGIGVGGYAVARGIRTVFQQAEGVVGYERQRVAAVELAGTQQKLNTLMEAYNRASGGAIDKLTQLENVTRLLATGFADTEEDIERFVRATRGASIALGKPQSFVIYQAEQTIGNLSLRRLNQIGLGVAEVQARIAAVREENKHLTREQVFGEAVLGLLNEKYGALADTQAGAKTGMELLRAAWSDLMLAFGQGVEGPINAASRAISDLINTILRLQKTEIRVQEGTQPRPPSDFALPSATSMQREDVLATNKQFFEQFFKAGTKETPWWRPFDWDWGMLQDPFQDMRPQQLAPPSFGPPSAPSVRRPPVDWVKPPLWEFGDEGADVLRNFHAQDMAITANYNRMKLDATAQYEEQRANVIRSYGKQMAREEEDFNRQRARGLRDYLKAVADLISDAQERERKLLRDYNERVADLTRDYNERVADLESDLAETIADKREASEKKIAEMQEKYTEAREKAELAHRDRLLKAASRLDAVAVEEERRRWKRENEERTKGHEEAIDKEKESLQEQIDAAQKAHDKRLDDANKSYTRALEDAKKSYDRSFSEAREADAKRLEQMRFNRAQQLADEDEDRAIRKGRAAQDHQEQLDEMARQHQLTLTRLAKEAADQREVMVTALEDNLAALDIWLEGVKERHEERDKAVDEWFDGILDLIYKKIEEDTRRLEAATGPISVGSPDGTIHSFARGGSVKMTGPAMLHAGEFVLSRDMLAAGLSSQSSSFRTSNRNITIESGAIQVATTPGYEHQAGELLEEALIRILDRENA